MRKIYCTPLYKKINHQSIPQHNLCQKKLKKKKSKSTQILLSQNLVESSGAGPRERSYCAWIAWRKSKCNQASFVLHVYIFPFLQATQAEQSLFWGPEVTERPSLMPTRWCLLQMWPWDGEEGLGVTFVWWSFSYCPIYFKARTVLDKDYGLLNKKINLCCSPYQ